MSHKPYNNVIFFNYFHRGDIHMGRNFIKKMMDLIPANMYISTHENDPYILSDIKGLNHLPFSEFKRLGVPHTVPFAKDGNGNLFINTWIGQQCEDKADCCSFPNYVKVFNQTLSSLGFEEMKGGEEIFPSIDYSVFNINEEVDNFFDVIGNNVVLISNGDVLSGQCENFDFNPIIKKLSDNHKDLDFIITNSGVEKLNNLSYDNIFYAEDLIKKEDGCDLNEISYISTKCRVIIGRNSGPHTFCLTKENITNKDMINIVICEKEKEADYSAHVYPECNMKTVWAPYNSINQVYDLVNDALENIKMKEVVQ
jgi:hypothetical protein